MKTGDYHFRVAKQCSAAYRQILGDLPRRRVSEQKFKRSLGLIKALGDQGERPPGSTDVVGHTNRFAVSIYGYRFHVEVDEAAMTLTIVAIGL